MNKFSKLASLILLFVALGYGCTSDNQLTQELSPTDQEKNKSLSKIDTEDTIDSTLTVGDIYGQYLKNELAFTQKHEGKSFEFLGTISSIKTTLMGCSVIVFNMTDEHDEVVGQVNCMNCVNLTDKWRKKLLKLKVGDEVKINGIYSSALAANTLTFNNCKLLK